MEDTYGCNKLYSMISLLQGLELGHINLKVDLLLS
jgi:hypothetical protein